MAVAHVRAGEEMVHQAKPEQFLYLTTRGRKSGLPREIEIWFVAEGDCFYVLAEYPTSHWVQNLQACSDVQVRLAGRTFSARARILPQDHSSVIAVVQGKFRQKYGWGEGLVVQITPSSSQVS